jgi:group II intron reverse transcriptase/maturase
MMQTKLNLITKNAREDRGMKFNNLIHLINEENLKQCFKELKKNKAVGIDEVTLEEYGAELETNVRDLIERMKQWKYRPQPVKRVYIEKSNGKLRPLGIPTVEDKLVQMCVKKILEAIYEVDFLDNSYGFRPGKSCHQALDRVDKIIMQKPVNWVIDADIRGFFDNVDHKLMRKCLEQRISDRSFLRLMVRMLKNGVFEEGKVMTPEKGTPQGAVLSPILANIYLHYALDMWLRGVIKKEARGYVEMVRYCDDFVIFAEKESEVEWLMQKLEERLKRCALELSKEKSAIVQFGRNSGKGRGMTFNFLGFTHFNDQTRKGYYKVGRKTEKKRLNKSLKEMNLWLKRVRNLVEAKEWWKTLVSKMRGHFQYYGVSGNMASISKYYFIAVRLVKKWLNRRSQKKKYNWERFNEYLQRHPLPRPKIYHNLYTLYGF